VKNGDQIANSTRRCAPTRQNRPLFEVSISHKHDPADTQTLATRA
jgi:hypothetical protein